ncbi:MAG: ATP-binding protein [Nitrospiraceae bacterium]|nr:ATP-binding protein [Nitrospiraceae bacterium]
MKIEHKIILSNVFNVALIVLIGLFAFQNLNLMLTKLRFVEIADDLNASFLEMRLSEKNFFLYKDEAALFDIREKIDKTVESIGLVKNDVVRAVGEKNFELLNLHLKSYSDVVEEMRKSANRNLQMEAKLRTEGKKLKEFSENITHLERTGVNDIISNSKRILFYSFWAIFLSAIVVSHFISQKILRSLREIENLAMSISEGNFRKIEGIILNDELGAVIKAINFMSEELRNREEQIIQSKKLASLGVLTAGVAHELTNPLNNISMIAQTYTELYDKLNREERIEFMNKVEGETERIKEIVRNLLDFSKPKEANLKKTNINEVISKTLNLVQNMIDISNIETRLNLKDGLPPLFIDEHQIQQVLVNLITNAVQAMSGGGVLFIASRDGSSSGFVEVTVMDTGKGIPPEFLPHIFDPFFSTKGVGGTGLGLSVSYGIIKKHKGDIRVESKVGVGTTFTIELPVYKEEK